MFVQKLSVPPRSSLQNVNLDVGPLSLDPILENIHENLANAKSKVVLTTFPLWTFRGKGLRHVKGQGLQPATVAPEKKFKIFQAQPKNFARPTLFISQ